MGTHTYDLSVHLLEWYNPATTWDATIRPMKGYIFFPYTPIEHIVGYDNLMHAVYMDLQLIHTDQMTLLLDIMHIHDFKLRFLH